MIQFEKEILTTLAAYDASLTFVLNRTPDLSEGHLAIPCFEASKKLAMSPMVLAEELGKHLMILPFLQAYKVHNGYLNLFYKPGPYQLKLFEIMTKEGKTYGSTYRGRNKKALLEHTSINPNASPHVGRGRNALIGDALARLIRFEGYETEVHYFVNDIGKQIAMLLYGTKDLESLVFDDLLDLYIKINEAATKDPAIEDAVFDLLYRLEAKDPTVRAGFRHLVSICIQGQTNLLKKLGISYDIFDYESDFLFNGSLDDILTAFSEGGHLFTDEEGRQLIKQSAYKLPLKSPYLVLTRRDKTSLYPLRDLAYTKMKMSQNTDLNLIVLGEDQKLYHQQILAGLDMLGLPGPEAVHYAFVVLKEGKMATRQGNVVLLSSLMEEAKSKAYTELSKRHGPGRDLEERAAAIAYSAIRYAILKVSKDRQVTFDWDQVLSFEGDSGPYLQYTYARICSIIKKTGTRYEGIIPAILEDQEAISLLLLLGNFPKTCGQAFDKRSPHLLCLFTYQLATAFSDFYHTHKVLGAKEASLGAARLKLCQMTKEVLETCFNLLGISPLDVM